MDSDYDTLAIMSAIIFAGMSRRLADQGPDVLAQRSVDVAIKISACLADTQRQINRKTIGEGK